MGALFPPVPQPLQSYFGESESVMAIYSDLNLQIGVDSGLEGQILLNHLCKCTVMESNFRSDTFSFYSVTGRHPTCLCGHYRQQQAHSRRLSSHFSLTTGRETPAGSCIHCHAFSFCLKVRRGEGFYFSKTKLQYPKSLETVVEITKQM